MAYKKTITLLSVFLGFWFSNVAASELSLNAEEQTYLQEHPAISLCIDPDWLPYEKLNAEGQHIGLVAEYMALIQSKLNVSMEVVKTNSWAETQQLYQSGACDIVSALNKNSERAQYLSFTKAYINSPAPLVLNENNKQVSQLSDLNGKTLGMVKGYVYESKLREDYPEIEILYQENMNTALQKVSTCEIDATIGPLFLSFALIQELNLDNVTIVGNTEYRDELRIGINKDNLVLANIMNKAVFSISPNDNATVRQSWSKKRKNQQ